MKALQWSMTIPKNKQTEFCRFSKEVLGSTWKKFGCIRYELYKVTDQPIIGHLILESNRFIEQLSFQDEANLSNFFKKVKKDPEAWKSSRMYEQKFGAKDIELRILNDACKSRRKG